MLFNAATIAVRGKQTSALRDAMSRTGTAVNRLSTGLRINSAADDAAGLAISEKTTARIRSRNQAIRNIQDGISALQTAEGGLQTTTAALARMRELALQSANGTYSDEQRGMLNGELTSLVQAVDETTAHSEWNGMPLLRSNLVDVVFVIDTSASMGGEIDTLSDSVADFRDTFAATGIAVQFGLVESSIPRDNGDGTIRHVDVGEAGFEAALDAMSLVGSAQDPYTVLYNITGVDDRPGTSEPDTISFRPGAERRIVLLTDTGKETSVPGSDPSESNLAAAMASAGVIVDVIGRPATSGAFDEIVAATGGAFYDIGDTWGSNIPAALDEIAAQVSAAKGWAADSASIQAGPSADDVINIDLPLDATANGLGIASLDISTRDKALGALDQIDDAMGLVSRQRATLGANQNALEYAHEAQLHTVEADQATRATIRDADVAQEASSLSAARIRAQSTTVLTAQTSRLTEDQILTLVQSAGK